MGKSSAYCRAKCKDTRSYQNLVAAKDSRWAFFLLFFLPRLDRTITIVVQAFVACAIALLCNESLEERLRPLLLAAWQLG